MMRYPDNAVDSADEINEQKSNTEKNNTVSFHQPSGKCKDDKNKELKIPRRSTRDKKSPIKYPENSSNNIYVNFCRVDTPYTFEHAMDSKDRENWIKAMDNEIESLNENKIWVLVNKQEDKEILELKWVYTRKSNDVFKARLVVRGF